MNLSRTLRAGAALGEGEGDSSGIGEGVGVIDGDSSGVGEVVGVGLGDSCAEATQIDPRTIRIARLTFLLMSNS